MDISTLQLKKMKDKGSNNVTGYWGSSLLSFVISLEPNNPLITNFHKNKNIFCKLDRVYFFIFEYFSRICHV